MGAAAVTGVEGAGVEGGEGTATGSGGGVGAAACAGVDAGGDELGSGADGRGFVSCVWNSDEIGSIGVRGGMDWVGGGAAGAGADSTTVCVLGE